LETPHEIPLAATLSSPPAPPHSHPGESRPYRLLFISRCHRHPLQHRLHLSRRRPPTIHAGDTFTFYGIVAGLRTADDYSTAYTSPDTLVVTSLKDQTLNPAFRPYLLFSLDFFYGPIGNRVPLYYTLATIPFSYSGSADIVAQAVEAPVPIPVPEPSTLLMLATGLLGAVGAARRHVIS
jgi:hypothetical protein